MATWTIKSIRQPRVQDISGGDYADADYLLAQVVSDEHQEVSIQLPFATYAGLEAEWAAGSVFTVADAAVDTEVAAITTTADDGLPAGTLTGKEGYSVTA